MRRRRSSWRVGVVAVAVVLGALALPAPAGAGNPWFRVPAPSRGYQSQLWSVSCPAPDACYAVGYETGPPYTRFLARTTNGTTWSRVSLPLEEYDGIAAVSCVAPTRCTAVGTALVRVFAPHPLQSVLLVLRTTDGVTWRRSTHLGPRDSFYVADVSCAFGTHCTAIGDARPFGGPFVMRTTDGVRWVRRDLTIPEHRDRLLAGLDCPTALNCTAVGAYFPTGSNPNGRTLVMRTSDGVHWAHVPTPNPAPSQSESWLTDVSCVRGSLTCVAVGSAHTGAKRAFILRTANSVTWTRAATPAGTTWPDLTGVDCQSKTECTAVGVQYPPSPLDGRVVLLRTTDGLGWSSPSPGSERGARELADVSCATPVRCVAVGFVEPPDRFLARKSLVLRES
jgi:hypothetical protein